MINKEVIPAFDMLLAWWTQPDAHIQIVLISTCVCGQLLIIFTSISARANEMVLITLNMRDGSLLCVGKGNSNWNFSAPHSGGRIMSRNEAKRVLSLRDFRESMDGIYSTSIRKDTLDEAPMAYKSLESLQEYLDQTVEILHHLAPLYNFKASGD